MKSFFKKYRQEFILGILICIYIFYFTTASFLRYDNFFAGRYDLGNMDQTVWNTIKGNIFQASNDYGITTSRLAYHADFILILISPFYLLWNNPKTLLLLQTLILSFGGIIIYLIAKDTIKNKWLAIIFSSLFLMNPLVQYTNLYDFHAVALATTFLLVSFYFFLKKKYFLLTIFLMLSGLSKEQVWIIVSFFGLPLLFQKSTKVKLLGAGIISISLAIFFYLIEYAIPHSLGAQHFALTYYSDFGNSPLKIISNVIFSPQKVLPIFFESSRLKYLFELFLPVGFISILSPLSLAFAVPDLLINLVSNNSGLRQIYYQYSANITPFIFISAIIGVKNILKWFPKIPKYYIASYLLFFTFVSAYFLGPLPGTRNPSTDMFTKPQVNKTMIEKVLLSISDKYTVAATNNLGAHLSHRKTIYTIPIGAEKADVILFLLNDRFAQPSLKAQIKMANDLKINKNYIKVFEKDDFIVFKKQGVLL